MILHKQHLLSNPNGEIAMPLETANDPAPRDEFGRYIAAEWTADDLEAFESLWANPGARTGDFQESEKSNLELLGTDGDYLKRIR
jgi:hypothetical protein